LWLLNNRRKRNNRRINLFYVCDPTKIRTGWIRKDSIGLYHARPRGDWWKFSNCIIPFFLKRKNSRRFGSEEKYAPDNKKDAASSSEISEL